MKCGIRRRSHYRLQGDARAVAGHADGAVREAQPSGGTCRALVADSAQRLRPLIEALGTASAWLPGYRIKALDGNHIASTGVSWRFFAIVQRGRCRSVAGRSGTRDRIGDADGGLGRTNAQEQSVGAKCSRPWSQDHHCGSELLHLGFRLGIAARRLLRDPSPCKHACHVVGKPPMSRAHREQEVLEQVVT